VSDEPGATFYQFCNKCMKFKMIGLLESFSCSKGHKPPDFDAFVLWPDGQIAEYLPGLMDTEPEEMPIDRRGSKP
jgi:hypothetical protein